MEAEERLLRFVVRQVCFLACAFAYVLIGICWVVLAVVHQDGSVARVRLATGLGFGVVAVLTALRPTSRLLAVRRLKRHGAAVTDYVRRVEDRDRKRLAQLSRPVPAILTVSPLLYLCAFFALMHFAPGTLGNGVFPELYGWKAPAAFAMVGLAGVLIEVFLKRRTSRTPGGGAGPAGVTFMARLVTAETVAFAGFAWLALTTRLAVGVALLLAASFVKWRQMTDFYRGGTTSG